MHSQLDRGCLGSVIYSSDTRALYSVFAKDRELIHTLHTRWLMTIKTIAECDDVHMIGPQYQAMHARIT